jgi:hypothetical protein
MPSMLSVNVGTMAETAAANGIPEPADVNSFADVLLVLGKGALIGHFDDEHPKYDSSPQPHLLLLMALKWTEYG